MAYSPDFRAPPLAAGAAQAAVLDQGLRAYMLRVYNWMASGLVLTAIVAFAVANTSLRDAFYHPVVTEFGQTVMRPTGLSTLCMFAPIGFVMVLSFGVNRLSRTTAQALYWAFCGVMGASLANIFLVYSQGSIASTFFVTAAMFGGMSIWGYTTKKDLSGFGSFLIMGVIGLLLAMVANIFLHSGGLSFIVNVLGVFIFAGLIAYNTQRLKMTYYQLGGDAQAISVATNYGALSLYINFINLFQFLLSFTGSRR